MGNNKNNPIEFIGSLAFDTPLSENQRDYLIAFARTKRIKRSAIKAKRLDDPLRVAVGLDIGVEGCYYVGGIEIDASVIKRSIPPEGQPTIACKWEPSPTGKSIVWAGKKFYGYVEWLEYLINHFLIPWKRKISGIIQLRNEDGKNLGYIKVVSNQIELKISCTNHDETYRKTD